MSISNGLSIFPHDTPVYVDPLMSCIRSRRWGYSKACHLFVATRSDLDALHELAAVIGLKRAWFQTSNRGVPHYDLCASKRKEAIKLGAIELDRSSAGRIFRCWHDQAPRKVGAV